MRANFTVKVYNEWQRTTLKEVLLINNILKSTIFKIYSDHLIAELNPSYEELNEMYEKFLIDLDYKNNISNFQLNYFDVYVTIDQIQDEDIIF